MVRANGGGGGDVRKEIRPKPDSCGKRANLLLSCSTLLARLPAHANSLFKDEPLGKHQGSTKDGA